jgi:hypothetical protein
MNSLLDALERLFNGHGWEVRRKGVDPRFAAFALVAESEVAIAFVQQVLPTSFVSDVASLSAAVGNFLHDRVGPKAWEAYLVLLVDGMASIDADDLEVVQRDLTWCRKVIVDAQQIRTADDQLAYLEGQLAILFPLDATEAEVPPSVRKLLINELIARGLPRELVEYLASKSEDDDFDAVSFLISSIADQKAT